MPELLTFRLEHFEQLLYCAATSFWPHLFFFEIIIWLVAAAQVLTNLDQWYLALAYASGFAAGNFVGISIESYFSIGNELIRCISFSRDLLAGKLREDGYKVVSFDGDTGEAYPVELLLL